MADKFRYYLISEPERIDKSYSQTSDVNLYYIRSNKKIPNLRVIDTLDIVILEELNMIKK